MATAPLSPIEPGISRSASVDSPNATPSRPRSSSPGGRRRWIIIAATAIVALVIIASVAIVGLSPTSKGGTVGPLTERSAATLADQFASKIQGGPWAVLQAAGNDLTLGETVALSPQSISYECPPNLTTQQVTVPGYNGSYSTGLAEIWWVTLVSGTSAAARLYVAVQNGSAYEVGMGKAPTCPPVSPLPGGLVDSATAASAAFATRDGQEFLANVTHANASYELLAGLPTFGTPPIPLWLLTFDGCKGAYGFMFTAELYASNSTVASAGVSSGQSEACAKLVELASELLFNGSTAGPCPAGAGIAPGSMDGCRPGDFTYVVTLMQAGIQLGGFELVVFAENGSVFRSTGPASFAVVASSGEVIASSPLPAGPLEMNASWLGYASGVNTSTPMVLTETIVVDMGQASSTRALTFSLQATGINNYVGICGINLY